MGALDGAKRCQVTNISFVYSKCVHDFGRTAKSLRNLVRSTFDKLRLLLSHHNTSKTL